MDHVQVYYLITPSPGTTEAFEQSVILTYTININNINMQNKELGTAGRIDKFTAFSLSDALNQILHGMGIYFWPEKGHQYGNKCQRNQQCQAII